MFDSTSAAEKIGWLGLVGSIIVAFVQVVRFLARFSEEHSKFMEHIEKSEPLIERFYAIEEAAKLAERERSEIITELRGLRGEINAVLTLMVQGYQKGH